MADIEKVIKGLERCLKHTCPDIYSKEYKECEYTVGLYCGQDKLLHEALELLKEQQPKHGHWIEQEGFDGDVYYDCSVCGESWVTVEGTPEDNGMIYCPHCGAKMDEPKAGEQE